MSDIYVNCNTWRAGEAQGGQGAKDIRQLIIQQSITRKWRTKSLLSQFVFGNSSMKNSTRKENCDSRAWGVSDLDTQVDM